MAEDYEYENESAGEGVVSAQFNKTWLFVDIDYFLSHEVQCYAVANSNFSFVI
jgi:hypothetical protein